MKEANPVPNFSQINIDIMDLSEVKSFDNPPIVVKNIMEALLLLLG